MRLFCHVRAFLGLAEAVGTLKITSHIESIGFGDSELDQIVSVLNTYYTQQINFQEKGCFRFKSWGGMGMHSNLQIVSGCTFL